MSQEATAAAAAVAAASGLPVVLADGEEQANILAKLLKQHIDAIVEADAAKGAAALKIRGKLGLHSTEPEAEATLVFGGAGVLIRNGVGPDCDGKIRGRSSSRPRRSSVWRTRAARCCAGR